MWLMDVFVDHQTYMSNCVVTLVLRLSASGVQTDLTRVE